MKKIIVFSFLFNISVFSIAQNVGIGTNAPTPRLHVADSAVLFTGPSTVPSTTTYYTPIQGGGIRMMWYPQKAAFRVGYTYANEWDFGNIGKYTFATGNSTKSSGDSSTVMGNGTSASGHSSISIGYGTYASGSFSTAIGTNSTASGEYSTAMGGGIIAKSFAERSIGFCNTKYTPLYTNNWNATDRLFTIGNGANIESRSDAMVVLKNGNIGIGVSSPAYKLQIGSSNNGLRIEGPSTTGTGGSALNIGGACTIVVDAPNVVGGRFFIKENGNVGISNNVPAYKLDVFGDINAAGNVRANGIALISDVRFKQNITDIPNALHNLLQLRGVNYSFNLKAFLQRNFSTDTQLGVIAQLPASLWLTE